MATLCIGKVFLTRGMSQELFTLTYQRRLLGFPPVCANSPFSYLVEIDVMYTVPPHIFVSDALKLFFEG